MHAGPPRCDVHFPGGCSDGFSPPHPRPTRARCPSHGATRAAEATTLGRRRPARTSRPPALRPGPSRELPGHVPWHLRPLGGRHAAATLLPSGPGAAAEQQAQQETTPWWQARIVIPGPSPGSGGVRRFLRGGRWGHAPGGRASFHARWSTHMGGATPEWRVQVCAQPRTRTIGRHGRQSYPPERVERRHLVGARSCSVAGWAHCHPPKGGARRRCVRTSHHGI